MLLVCSFSCDFDVQLSHQRFAECPGGLGTFGFPFCKPISIHPVYMIFPCSSPDSGPSESRGVANSISQNVAKLFHFH